MKNADCMVEQSVPSFAAEATGLPPFVRCVLAVCALRYLANAPIGSHAGSIWAGSSSALRYASGRSAFGTATS